MVKISAPSLSSAIAGRLTGVTVLTMTLAAGSPARADGERGFSVRAEGGLGSMLSAFQRDTLDYGVALQGSLRPAWHVADAVALELALGSWLFPSEAGTGRASLLGVGARFEPSIGERLRWFVDAHGGLGLSGDKERFMFDLGAGVAYALGPQIALGELAPISWTPGLSRPRTMAPVSLDFVWGSVAVA